MSLLVDGFSFAVFWNDWKVVVPFWCGRFSHGSEAVERFWVLGFGIFSIYILGKSKTVKERYTWLLSDGKTLICNKYYNP